MRIAGSHNGLTTSALRVLVLVALLALMQGSFARTHNSGEMLALEMQLAPYLAAGGSLDDLCEDNELYCSGCAECTMCCAQLLAAVPMAQGSVERLLNLEILRVMRPLTVATPPSRAPPGPQQARAPPFLT